MPYDQVMSKWKAGTLKSGGGGKPVKSQAQAVAIMLSEKRAAKAGKTEYAAAQPPTAAMPHPHRNLGAFLHAKGAAAPLPAAPHMPRAARGSKGPAMPTSGGNRYRTRQG